MARTRQTARKGLHGYEAPQAHRRPSIPSLWSSGRAQRPIYINETALGDALPVAAPVFYLSVEAWRSDVQSAGGDFPINFLLMWIQKESAGNPCSWTSLQEAGIMQLMAGDNIAQGKTTMAQQHPVPPCSPGVQTTAFRSSLTNEQAKWQVDGGLTYVRYCRDRARTYLSQAGYKWSESDWSFWAMVKMIHVAPAVIPGMLAAGTAGNGGVPAPDWDTMMLYVTGVPPSWTDNARAVGIYGQGGASILGALSSNPVVAFGLLGSAAALLILMLRRQGRRGSHAA